MLYSSLCVKSLGNGFPPNVEVIGYFMDDITKEELHKKFDCFNRFYAMGHRGCAFRGAYGNEDGREAVIIKKDKKYICEKCEREVSKEIWASMFKKHVPLP